MSVFHGLVHIFRQGIIFCIVSTANQLLQNCVDKANAVILPQLYL